MKEATRVNTNDTDTQTEEVAKRTQAQTLKHYRANYRTSVTGSGRKSQASVSSAVATEWEGNDHGKIAQWTSLLLGVDPLTHFKKYAHLNNGQMRMNCGNLVNSRVKKGEITVEQMRKVMKQAITETSELESQTKRGTVA